MSYYAQRATPYRVEFAAYSVLVVDDEPVARRILIQALRSIGFFRIDQAIDGETALAMLRAGERYDVAISDVGMKPMDGVAFLGRVRAEAAANVRDIPVLFVTGTADAETVRKASGLRPTGYVLKPARPEQLSQRLAGALGLAPAP
jgi:two-component system, chemotaxis family, chemotaxis protein CheY